MPAMHHTEACGRDSGCLGCAQEVALLIATAVEAERERIATAIEDACPHEDEHPEGTCEVCDLTAAAEAIARGGAS